MKNESKMFSNRINRSIIFLFENIFIERYSLLKVIKTQLNRFLFIFFTLNTVYEYIASLVWVVVFVNEFNLILLYVIHKE